MDTWELSEVVEASGCSSSASYLGGGCTHKFPQHHSTAKYTTDIRLVSAAGQASIYYSSKRPSLAIYPTSIAALKASQPLHPWSGRFPLEPLNWPSPSGRQYAEAQDDDRSTRYELHIRCWTGLGWSLISCSMGLVPADNKILVLWKFVWEAWG